jgi:hypothetical protein
MSASSSKAASLDWEVPVPWAVHAVGEAVGLLAAATGLLVVVAAGLYRKGRWVAAGGCMAAGSAWMVAGCGYLDLGQRANFRLCCARAGVYILLGTTACLGIMKSPSGSARKGCVVIVVLAGTLELLSSLVYWVVILQALVSVDVDQGPWTRAWALRCAADEGIWLGAALLATGLRIWAARGRKRCSVNATSHVEEELLNSGRDGAWESGVCDDHRRAHEFAAEMAQGLPLTVRQRHGRKASIFNAAGSGEDEAGGNGTATGTRPALRCLNQLLAQAAGLDPFLRDRVRRWALLSGGCFLVAAAQPEKKSLSFSSSLRSLFQSESAAGGSKLQTAGCELLRFSEVAENSELRSRIRLRWQRAIGLRRAAAELCCWEFAGEPDPSALLDYCRQVKTGSREE